jgi:hypothetical protein
LALIKLVYTKVAQASCLCLWIHGMEARVTKLNIVK